MCQYDDDAENHIFQRLDQSEEGMFVRTLQCLAAQQQKNQAQQNQLQGGGGGGLVGGGPKEANLMPVPSPQKIQYLNTFEGKSAR